jgi:phage gpG-like protein
LGGDPDSIVSADNDFCLHATTGGANSRAVAPEFASMLTGDFAKLTQWSRKFDKLGSGSLRFSIASDMANAHLKAIARQFERERNPYGVRWRPKQKPDGRKTLRGPTGKLRRFRKITVNQHGYRVGSEAPYLRYHQKGTSRMVARKVIPDEQRIPGELAREFKRIYAKRMKRALR